MGKSSEIPRSEFSVHVALELVPVFNLYKCGFLIERVWEQLVDAISRINWRPDIQVEEHWLIVILKMEISNKKLRLIALKSRTRL